MTSKVLIAGMLAGLSYVVTAGVLAQTPPESARLAFPIPSSVRVTRDVPYAKYGQRELKLDIYQPPEGEPRRAVPGIIVVRGGGWLSGDKEAFGFIAAQLAKEGFAAASVEYRTASEARFPAAVYDVKAAVRWMRVHAAKYQIDPNAIGAIGGSAGGHLVALLATSSGVKTLEGVGGNGETSSEIQAVVAMACACNLESVRSAQAVRGFIGDLPADAYAQAARLASPAAHVSKHSAPMLLLHSRTDPVVPFEQSTEIEGLYRRHEVPAVLREVEAPNIHAFWNDARHFPSTISEATQFLRKYLTK
jgi:pectinesterase